MASKKKFKKPTKLGDKPQPVKQAVNRLQQMLMEISEMGEAALTDIPLSPSVDDNAKKMQEIFLDCSDAIIRPFTLGKQEISCLLVYIDGMIDKKVINDDILRSLMVYTHEREISLPLDLETIKKALITVGEIKEMQTLKDAIGQILQGYTIVFTEGNMYPFSIETKGWEKRAVGPPQTEPVVRGPQEAFTESIRTNTALIRRRIKTPDLKMESFELGRTSKTAVVVAYIKGIAAQGILQEIKKRLNRIDFNIDIIADSSYVEFLIEDSTFSPFPNVESTERPDICTGSLAEGRFVILVDGSPFALIVPVVLADFMTSAEDYYQRFPYAIFIRALRYISFLLALLGPSLYIAITTFHQEMIPPALLITISASRAAVPFPSLIEALLMEVTFEILREAGIRLPKAVGEAVSIVGALVIGQGAVQAGIVSQAMVIVVAVTGLASFNLPKYNFAISLRFLRFPMMFLAAAFGIFGIIMGGLVLLINMAALRSLGVPYLYPYAPMKSSSDSFIRLPLWAMRRRPMFLEQKNPHRMSKGLMPRPPKKGGN